MRPVLYLDFVFYSSVYLLLRWTMAYGSAQTQMHEWFMWACEFPVAQVAGVCVWGVRWRVRMEGEQMFTCLSNISIIKYQYCTESC